MGNVWTLFWSTLGKLIGVIGKGVDMLDNLADGGVELSEGLKEAAHDYRLQTQAEREAEHAARMKEINKKRKTSGLKTIKSESVVSSKLKQLEEQTADDEQRAA